MTENKQPEGEEDMKTRELIADLNRAVAHWQAKYQSLQAYNGKLVEAAKEVIEYWANHGTDRLFHSLYKLEAVLSSIDGYKPTLPKEDNEPNTAPSSFTDKEVKP